VADWKNQPEMPVLYAKLTQQELEAHLWAQPTSSGARLPGRITRPNILTLMFFKRLSDQWDAEPRKRDSVAGAAADKVQRRPAQDPHGVAAHHRFKIPDGCHWIDVLGVAENIGAMLNAAMRGGPDPRDQTKQITGIAPPIVNSLACLPWTGISQRRTARASSSQRCRPRTRSALRQYQLVQRQCAAGHLGRAYE